MFGVLRMRVFRRRNNHKYLKLIPLFAVAVFGLAFFANAKLWASAANVSSNLTITEAHAYTSDDTSRELSLENTLGTASFWIGLNWKYESDTPIANGDQASFNIASTSNSIVFIVPDMAPSDIYNDRNEKIGTWKISSKKIIITFSDAAVGRQSLNGYIKTARNIHTNSIHKDDRNIVIVVGNISIDTIHLGKEKLPASSYGAAKAASSQSNDKLSWALSTPGITINELYKGDGQVALSSEAKLSNLIIEDPLSSSSISSSAVIYARVMYPVLWDDGAEGASGNGCNFNITSLFARKDSTSDEAGYEDYKASLNEFEYGYFTDLSTGVRTLVINIGSQPSSLSLQDALVAAGYGNKTIGQQCATDDGVSAAIDRFNWNNNVVGGAVTYFRVGLSLDFNAVSLDTPITNIATFSYDDANGQHYQVQKTSTSSLKVGNASSEIKGEAKLYLRDEATKMPITGANLKLQMQDGTDWADVADGAKTTGTDGSIQVLSLEPGAKYRWVQTSFLDHYLTDSFKLYSDEAMNTVITEFTMPEDTGITTYATNEKESFTITYKAGAHGDFSDIVFRKQYYGSTAPQPTPEQIVAVAGWTFAGWSPSVANVVTSDATYTAQWQRQTKSESVSIIWDDSDNPNNTRPDSVKVQLLQNGSNYGSEDTISGDDHWTKTWSGLPAYSDDGATQYTYTIENNSTVPGYTATVGQANNGTHTVTFKIKQATVTTNHYAVGTATEIADTVTQTLDYGTSYNTSEKTIANYVFDSVVGTPSGVVGADNITVTYYYRLKTTTITTHYYIKDTTTKITDDVVETKNYTENYETHPLATIPVEYQNYELVSSEPANYKGVVDKDNIIVIYYYQKKDATLSSSIMLSAPESVNNKKTAVNYNLSYAANIKDYIGAVKTTITAKLPYPIVAEESELDGAVYNAEAKTLTWVKTQNYNTYTDGENYSIEHGISLVYDGAQAKDQLLATAEATIELDGKDNDTAASAETLVKTPAVIVYRFIDQDGNEIQKEIEDDGFVGDKSNFVPPEIPGYKLVKQTIQSPEFGEEVQTIIYRYEKLPNPKTSASNLAGYFVMAGASITILGIITLNVRRRTV